jgi:phosphoribosyl 1,2-cyclic phosphate phosphodiesterase
MQLIKNGNEIRKNIGHNPILCQERSLLPTTITFLGTSDSMGVPRVYCSCTICKEARTSGLNKRWRSSILLEITTVGIKEMLLVDCGPDWQQQMELIGIKELEHVLVTHAHYDHIAGLPQWADACRWLDIKGHVYAPQAVIATILKTFSWLQTNLEFHVIDEGFTFSSWSIMPWKVSHGKNGYAYAYRFSEADCHWVYCPDSINLLGEQKKPLYDLALLILGTSFYEEPFDFETRSVYDIKEALELITDTKPKKVYFTHMSHGIDLVGSYDLPDHVNLAVTGYRISI